MSKDLNEAQKLLKPLIDKATQKKADARLAYDKALEELRYVDGVFRQAEAAYHALLSAFDAVGGKS
jgi:hypothetical protein